MTTNYRLFFELQTEPFSADIALEHILLTDCLKALQQRVHYAMRTGAVALITGENLLVPTEPLSAHTVEFLYGPEVDVEVMSRLTEKSSAHQLELEIKAGPDSKLGDHTVRLTIPAGIAHNPPSKFFEVRETDTDTETS